MGTGDWATIVGICGDVVHDWFDSRNVSTLFRPIARTLTCDLIARFARRGPADADANQKRF